MNVSKIVKTIIKKPHAKDEINRKFLVASTGI